MAVAVYMKSQSCDTYFYIMDGEPTQEEFQAEIERLLGDELAYIDECEIEATYEHELFVDFPKEDGEDDGEDNEDWQYEKEEDEE